MNKKITPHLPQITTRTGHVQALSTALLAVCTVAGTGCFRATGAQRSPTAAQVLPETGGDRVPGLKSKAGAGELFIGNDFIQVAIDSTVFGDPVRTPIAGAASGGSIIDAGYILLNGSFARVSIPGSVMNRLTPVVNQDPRQQIVFTSYRPVSSGDTASLTMTGGVLDAGGVPRTGVAVTHRISVALLDRFFTVTTTVTNNSGSTVPIRNIGDSLVQEGGGYAFNVPADSDAQDNPLAVPWGVQIPGSAIDTDPLGTSVRAPMVGLMNTEPGTDTADSHCSVGILPVDADQLLVAADAQDLLTVAGNLRPHFPERLVAGSLGAAADLAPGASLTYTRRLYLVGGTSVATDVVRGLTIAVNYPDQATGLFNLMDTHRFSDASLRTPQDTGVLTFSLSGMSQRQGPVPTEVRIERKVTTGLVDTFRLQRLEWLEPNENLASQTSLAPSTLQVRLPLGIYRMVLRSQNNTQTRTLFQNVNVVTNPDGSTQTGTEGPIFIQKDQEFVVSPQDILSPEAAGDTSTGGPNQVGTITNDQFSQHFFTTREANGADGNIQPMRITFQRTDGVAPVNPVMRRMRTLGSLFDPSSSLPLVAPGAIPAQYQFRGGNEMFGTGFTRLAPVRFAWFENGGSFTAFGSRGPMEGLQRVDLQAFPAQTSTSHILDFFPKGLPPQWTSFDLPGPGQATSGGYLPAEKLASATANGVQVLGHTERDIQVDATGLYNAFFAEYGSSVLTAATLPSSLSAPGRPPATPFGFDPFVVGGRTTSLTGFGEATTLFTPPPTNASLGGVLINRNLAWTLADFLSQGQGQFTVVHRPRGPLGLFTAQWPLGNALPGNWWFLPGASSNGLRNGDFDALELLRGAGVTGASVAAWFTEFQQVRTDWFNLLEHQSPARFTKALGLSSAQFSVDTPVGLARTYLKARPGSQSDLAGVLAALKSGAAVASTGPFLDVKVGTAGPGEKVPGPVANVTLVVNLWKTDWTPVDEIRVVLNGNVVLTVPAATLSAAGADSRLRTGAFNLPLPGRDSWIVVEAGVPLAGPVIAPADQGLWDTWNTINRNIYPIAVSNPIFVDVLGDGYPAPAPAL